MVKVKKSVEALQSFCIDENKQNYRLKLDLNENIYGASPFVVNAIKNTDSSDIYLYPSYGEVVDKIALKYNLKKDNVLLSNGCDEAIKIILDAYLDVDDEILSYNPTFEMPFRYANIIGAKLKLIEYDEKFVFDYKKIENNITNKTKIVYIATPNNPTGELARASLIEILSEKFSDILFVLDCTYINFSYNASFYDYLDLIYKHDNIVITKSFSKDYAIAGLRFGFIAAQAEIIKNLKKVMSPYNVNSVALNCVSAIINNNKEFEQIKEMNYASKKLLMQGLLDKGFKPYESEGNFIFCDFGEYCDFYYEKFKKLGIIVKKFLKPSFYSSFLRITIPKIGGVKFILELLNKKDVLIINPDGIIFDVLNSQFEAIVKTYEYFSKKSISIKQVLDAKNKGSLNRNWRTIQALLEADGLYIDVSKIVCVYNDILLNKNKNDESPLINKEKLLISKEILEELVKKYDLVIYTDRSRKETDYSLKRFDIDKYFYYIISADDLPEEKLKPSSDGIFNILKHCPYKTVKFLGSNVDDIIASNGANIKSVGVIPFYADKNSMINNYRHLGAYKIINDKEDILNLIDDVKINEEEQICL